MTHPEPLHRILAAQARHRGTYDSAQDGPWVNTGGLHRPDPIGDLHRQALARLPVLYRRARGWKQRP